MNACVHTYTEPLPQPRPPPPFPRQTEREREREESAYTCPHKHTRTQTYLRNQPPAASHTPHTTHVQVASAQGAAEIAARRHFPFFNCFVQTSFSLRLDSVNVRGRCQHHFFFFVQTSFSLRLDSVNVRGRCQHHFFCFHKW